MLGWHTSKIGQITIARARIFGQLLTTINMMSLIVNLHEISINDYIKNRQKQRIGR